MENKIKLIDTSEKVDQWTQTEIVPKMRVSRPLLYELSAIFGSVDKTFEKILAADHGRRVLAARMSEQFSAADLSAYHWLTEAKLKSGTAFQGRVRDLNLVVIFILCFGVFASVVFSEPDLLTGAFYLAAFIGAMHIGLAIFAGRRRNKAEELHEITKIALNTSRSPPEPQ